MWPLLHCLTVFPIITCHVLQAMVTLNHDNFPPNSMSFQISVTLCSPLPSWLYLANSYLFFKVQLRVAPLEKLFWTPRKLSMFPQPLCLTFFYTICIVELFCLIVCLPSSRSSRSHGPCSVCSVRFVKLITQLPFAFWGAYPVLMVKVETAVIFTALNCL